MPLSQEQQTLAGLLSSARGTLNLNQALQNRANYIGSNDLGGQSLVEFDATAINELPVYNELPRPVFLKGTQRVASYAVAKYGLDEPALPERGEDNDVAFQQQCNAAVLLRSATEREAKAADVVYARNGFRPLHVQVFELFVPSAHLSGQLAYVKKAFVPARLQIQPVEDIRRNPQSVAA